MLVSPVAVAPVAHESALANGLKVVIVPYSSAPVATVMVVYHVGARNEAVGYTGSSHLLEHMLFKGTYANSRANGRAFADIMNEIGASKNATTWIDRTNYFETVPLEFLPLAIELEADRMRNALIADVDRRSEMTVVRNELERNDNNPARVLSSALVATAFREHPYHHPTIGWRCDVEGVSTARLRELYDGYYHPNNATLFVVGDVDVERTQELIERFFGALPRAPVAIPDVYTTEPPQLGERSVSVKRPGEDTVLAYAYHAPAAFGQMTTLSSAELARRAGTRDNGEVYALEVLARVLGRGRTSRLARALVDQRLALDVAAWNWGSRDPGLFQILVSVTPGVAGDDVRRELERTLSVLAAEGPTAAEVERVRAGIVVQRAFARDGTYGLAQRLGEFEAVGSWHLDDDYVERISAITPDDVRDVMRAYLHDDNRTIGTLLPGTPKTYEVVPFEPVEARADGEAPVPMAPLPQPQRQAERRFADRIAHGRAAAGIETVYVANPQTATFAVRGVVDAGPAFAGGHPLLPSILGEMLARGTRSHDRIAIEERLERAGIRRTYFVDDDRSHGYNALAFRFAAACAAEDLPLLLETLAEELSEPAFPEAELDIVKTELVGALRLSRTSTSVRAMERFLHLAYDVGDPNYVPDLDALLAGVEAIGVADVRRYYEATFLHASAIVSAAGPLAPDAFAALAARTLGRVPLGPERRQARFVERVLPAREVREHVEIERKASVDIVLGRATSLVRSDDTYLAAAIANGILGQSTLSSRLGLQLRDREGLTYGVTSGFLSPARLAGPWRIGVTVNPANVERAIESARGVLRRYVADGPTQRELVQQRHSMAGSHRVALATNGGVAAQLERLVYYALGDDYVDAYRDQLDAVTLDDVHAACATYLDERDLIVASAGTLVRAEAVGRS